MVRPPDNRRNFAIVIGDAFCIEGRTILLRSRRPFTQLRRVLSCAKMKSTRYWRSHFSKIAVALLLLVMAGELGLSARRQSQTFDEADHVYAGYQYWRCRDFGINPEHPPFAKLVATIPLLFDRPRNPGPPCASYPTDKWGDFSLAHDFLYSNRPKRILTETRFFAASFALLLAVFVFLAAREMFGRLAGLLAISLVVFEPTILGQGALVKTDLAETCWFFAAVYAYYRYTKQQSALRLVTCGLAAGLALAAKHSGILLPPVLVLLAISDASQRWRDSVPSISARHSKWGAAIARQLSALAIIFVIAVSTLWGFYAFRYAARPPGHEMSESLPAFIQGEVQNRRAHSIMLTKVIPHLRHVLPESYLYGMADITADTVKGRPVFILGHLYPVGQWFYFPAALMIQGTLGFLLLLILTICASRYLWKEKRRETLFLVIPALFFLALSMTARLNLGIRHILPIFPFLIVLASGAAWHLSRQRRAWMLAVVFLVVFHCVSSALAFPHYLAYSNEVWGGTNQTYKSIEVDSGQGLIEIKDYLTRNGITDCWLDYHGTADLAYYGIPCKELTPSLGDNHEPEIIPPNIESTLVISTWSMTGWDWGAPELNPYAALWKMKPTAIIGGHDLVFRGRFELPLISASSRSDVAWSLALQGHVEEALSEARQSVDLAPEYMWNHVTLARILAKANQIPEARSEYLEAIRLSEVQGEGYKGYALTTARAELAALDSLH